MKVPYLMETCKAGKVTEVTKKYSARYHKKGIKRSANQKPTPEEMQRVNDRHAEATLRRSLNANFGVGDYHITLTYRKEDRPAPDDVPAVLEKFWRGMRRIYRRAGKELKYIAVTEWGKRGAIHHHIVVPAHDLQEIRKLWPYGGMHVSVLDDSGQYAKLASYLIKQTRQSFRSGKYPFGRRWNCSRNLVKPKIKVEVVGRNNWRKEPKPMKGYYLEQDKTVNGEFFGFEYQFYSMVLLTIQRRRC